MMRPRKIIRMRRRKHRQRIEIQESAFLFIIVQSKTSQITYLMRFEKTGVNTEDDADDMVEENEYGLTHYFNESRRTMHTSLIPLDCNAKAMATGNDNVAKLVLTSLNPNMNYGVLRCNRIAEMINNTIGNKAHVRTLPLPALEKIKYT